MTLPSWLPTVAAVAVGLLLGQAAHRWAARAAAGTSLLGLPGRCIACGGALPARVVVPLLNLLPGGTPACGHPLPSWRVPAILFPAAGGAALALVHGPDGWWALSQSLLLLYLLYPLVLIDLTALEVELRLIALGLALRFAGLGVMRDPQLVHMIGGMLMGAGLFALVAIFYQGLRGRAGLGEGDTVVMALIGAFVGWEGVLPVVALAATAGLLVGAPLLAARRLSLGSAMPFVPFLGVAGMAVYLGQTVWHEPWWDVIMAINRFLSE